MNWALVGGRHFYIPGANSEPPHPDETIKAGGPRPPGAMAAGSVRVKHYVFGMLRHCLFITRSIYYKSLVNNRQNIDLSLDVSNGLV